MVKRHGRGEHRSASGVNAVGKIVTVAAGERPLPAALVETEERGFRTGRYLADGPAIDRVAEDETVRFVMTNRQHGVAIQRGTTSYLLPDDRYQTVVVVTDCRVIALVGQDGGDQQFTLDISEIAAVAATRGRAGRLAVDCDDGTTLGIRTDASGLDAVAAYLRSEADAGRDVGSGVATRSLRSLFRDAVESSTAFERDRVAALLPTLARSARSGADGDADDGDGDPSASPRSESPSDAPQRPDGPDRETAIDDLLGALAKTDWRARGAKSGSPFDLLAEREDELVGVVVHCPGDGRVDHDLLRRCDVITGAAGTDAVVVATTGTIREADEALAATLGVRLVDVGSLAPDRVSDPAGE